MSNSNSFDCGRLNFLSEALPFISEYSGSTFVIKYGGSAMQNSSVKSDVISDICLLYLLGINLVLVHGGGFFINKWLARLNIKPIFHNGIRFTDHNTMEIVEMVLAGKLNKDLVSLFSVNNVLSIGLCGKDASLIKASPLYNESNNLAGKVKSVDVKILNLLLSNRYLPVVASVASDFNGKTYNINADSVASAIASALKADKLILLTDTPGILLDINDSSSLIKNLNLSRIKELESSSIISGGMIPKVNACINSLESGVKSTHIIDGRLKHSLLYELLTIDRVGSMIVA